MPQPTLPVVASCSVTIIFTLQASSNQMVLIFHKQDYKSIKSNVYNDNRCIFQFFSPIQSGRQRQSCIELERYNVGPWIDWLRLGRNRKRVIGGKEVTLLMLAT